MISVKNMSNGMMFLGLGPGRTKRTELVKDDLVSFEKALEKLVIEIYTPEIDFTEAD